MTTEIDRAQQAQLAKPSEAAVPMAGLEGFTMDEVVKYMPYLILIQGNNPLKDEHDCKDGDFILTNGRKLKTPVEFILIKTKTVYLEKEVIIDNKGNLKEDSPVINTLDTQEFMQLKPASKQQLDGFIAFKNEQGEIERLFIENKIFLGLVEGSPCQISFKTFMKRKSAAKIASELMAAQTRLGISNSFDAVIELKAGKQKNQQGIQYYTLDGVVKRKCTQEELATISAYTGLEIEYDAAQDVELKG